MPTNTPNTPRKRRRILRTTTIATLVTIAAYTAGAIHFALDEPTVTRDYYAEHNAAHAGLSKDQKAWTTYHAARDAWNDLTRPITHSVMALAHEDDNKQRELEAADPHYDRPPSPYENDDNPFGLPTDHPLYADALAALEAFQPTLAQIRNAATLPAIGIPLTDRWRNNLAWTPGEELEPSVNPFDRPPLIIQSMEKVKNFGFAHVFAFDSIAATGPAAPLRIIENTRTLIHIARQYHNEQTAIDQLVAHRHLSIASDAVLKSLERSDLNFMPDQLLTLQDLFWNDAAAESRLSIASDRRSTDEMIERIYSGRPGATGRITVRGMRIFAEMEGFEPPPRWLLAALWPTRYRFADRPRVERHFADSFQALDEFIAAGPETYPDFLVALNDIQTRESSGFPLQAAMTIEALAKAAGNIHTTRTKLQATATRLALERHKLAQGHYSDTLDALIPTYLPELPADPFNPGHPLNYLLRDDTPYIYSVGSNGIDNQATPAPPNTRPDSLEARFADPNGPSPEAPAADWILFPLQD